MLLSTEIARHFRFGNQEDAHEFLRYTIDAMQKACLNGYAKYVLPSTFLRGRPGLARTPSPCAVASGPDLLACRAARAPWERPRAAPPALSLGKAGQKATAGLLCGGCSMAVCRAPALPRRGAQDHG